MTDQRDTPDTRTPSAETVRDVFDRLAVPSWVRGPLLDGLRDALAPAPLGDATTGAEPTEGCGHRKHAHMKYPGPPWGGRIGLFKGTDDRFWEPCPASAPTEGTADRDALDLLVISKLLGRWFDPENPQDEREADQAAAVGALLNAHAALGDLTRENERLRQERDDWISAASKDLWDTASAHVAVVEAAREAAEAERDAARAERDAARAERDTIGARALDTLIEGGRCARRALRAEAQLAAVRAECDRLIAFGVVSVYESALEIGEMFLAALDSATEDRGQEGRRDG